ncbi:hypothetical protein ACN6LA_007224 [Streptomyces sp. SAS_269]|uniref:hypothetical protein n=1 Tax=Streptomyces sp. SAS_269 TaxID=3412749 RepID=UPI00403C4401
MYDAEKVAARIVDGLGRRRTAVCAPAWLRLVQSVRAVPPPLVPRVVRRQAAPPGCRGGSRSGRAARRRGDADRAARRHAR